MESIINIILTFLIFFKIKVNLELKLFLLSSVLCRTVERLLERCKGVFPADLLSARMVELEL